MAIATFIEKYQGSDYVHTRVYGSPWFVVLWLLMAVSAVCYILRRRMRSLPVLLLHFSLLLILLGALLTYLTSWQGFVHLRQGSPTSQVFVQQADDLTSERDLPFFLKLDTFTVRYYSGTKAPSDFISHFTITDAGGSRSDSVSMNNIASVGTIRLYQTSYDDDMQGSTLSVNCDPWGIPVSYAGYVLLFLSQLMVLLNPKGRFRHLLRTTARHSSAAAVLVLGMMLSAAPAHAARTLTDAQAEQFGRLNMLYGDRICPVQTFAIDFTRKLYGKGHFEGYSAEQVLAGFLFFPDEWAKEPVIRVKSGAVREHFHLPKYVSLSQFFSGGHQYLLGPVLQEYFAGNNDKLHQEVMKLDERIMLIMQLPRGTTMKLFPFQGVWYSPRDHTPNTMDEGRRQYIAGALDALGAYLKDDAHPALADEMLQKMQLYQQTFGAADLPSPARLQAERMYNAVPFATILFMVCLTAGILSLVPRRWMRLACLGVLAASFLALTLCLVLRWIVSGTIPMTNGYETMLLMAWIIMLASLLVYRHFTIILTFGLLLSGFLLLVSHLGQMDPQISNLMPVLASPLLSLHVSTIMMAYALLALTAASALYGLCLPRSAADMHRLSLLLLYPAIFLLTTGIFIGAVWANQSWGRYWGWDPKEVWALITMMVYALPMHSASFPQFQRPRFYHAYMLVAFLTILMTFFGVNYFLGGMHSYA